MIVVEASRREFLKGVGAALVTAALPGPVRTTAPTRQLPLIRVRIPINGYLTASTLLDCLIDLYSQVQDLAPLGLSSQERCEVSRMVDEALYDIKPVGLCFKLEATFDRMLKGHVQFVDDGVGTVTIS